MTNSCIILPASRSFSLYSLRVRPLRSFLNEGESVTLSGSISINMGIFKSDLLAVNGFNEDFLGWGREDSELDPPHGADRRLRVPRVDGRHPEGL